MQRWINPETARYYLADLVQDLLGDWTLVLCWGALGSGRGQMRVIVVASRQAGLEQMDIIAKRRQKRGYRLEFAEHGDRLCNGQDEQDFQD